MAIVLERFEELGRLRKLSRMTMWAAAKSGRVALILAASGLLVAATYFTSSLRLLTHETSCTQFSLIRLTDLHSELLLVRTRVELKW